MALYNLPALPFAILSILALATCLDFTNALGGPKTGGWQPIKDLKDPTVVEIGQYAVNEHNKQAKAQLKFQNVVRGESQVVAGINYKLVVAAQDGTASNQYEAVVWEKSWEKFRNLTSFRKLN